MGWTKNLSIAALAGLTGYIWTKLLLGDSRLQIAAVTSANGPTRVKPAPWFRYRAKRDSKVLHQEGCRYYDLGNLGEGFTNLDDAIEAGYRACRICVGSS